MANFEFCDTHNMVAYLHKAEGSEGFYQIQTAAANTLDFREVKITAIIYGKVKLVSEASIRRHPKLADSDGSLFPLMEILNPYHSSLIPTRHESEVPQPSSPTYTNVADEAAITSVDVIHRGASTTISSIDAGQSSGNIPKSPTMPHDSPLPEGHTPGRISLVTPTKVSSQEDQSEDQLEVLSAAKVLADASKKNVNTYTRRRRVVSTGSERVSTASRIFSTAEESVSTVGALMPVSTADMKLHEEEQARFNVEQEAKFNSKQEELLASETTEDEANPPVADIDWDDVQAQIQANEDLA
ncbi:hypothetical protein Tco_0810708 [Tanacetum coccineum]